MDAEKSPVCGCESCTRYRPVYNDIHRLGKVRWLTISPPHSDKDPLVYFKGWRDQLLKMNLISNELIWVTEMSDQLRMHFHLLYSLKDRVKEYIHINAWRKYAQVRVYDGDPRGGLHYLFKDIDTIREFLPADQVIHTRQSLIRTYAKTVKKKTRKVIAASNNDILKDIFESIRPDLHRVDSTENLELVDCPKYTATF